MKGYLLDFGSVHDTYELSGISDQVLRTLGDDEMILQMFSFDSRNVSIGYDDTKAPGFKEGVLHYQKNNYSVSVRGAGGRSIVGDPGVLNFSIIQKSTMTTHESYVFFFKFLEAALAPLGISFDLGEIKGAYCPGAYDISINTRKVSGTSSRNVNGNLAVGCFLNVNGDQEERSNLIKEFYEITDDVIRVSPSKMTTLEQESTDDVNVNIVKTLLIDHFKSITTSFEHYDTDKLDRQSVEASSLRAQHYNRLYL